MRTGEGKAKLQSLGRNSVEMVPFRRCFRNQTRPSLRRGDLLERRDEAGIGVTVLGQCFKSFGPVQGVGTRKTGFLGKSE